MNNHPQPGDTIILTGLEDRRKYGDLVLFKVVECLDGSRDVWFEDSLPYCDTNGNFIQSKCLPENCIAVRGSDIDWDMVEQTIVSIMANPLGGTK